VSAAWTDTLAAAEAGAISAPIALTRLLLSGDPPDPVRLAALAEERPALAALAALADTHEDALPRLAAAFAGGAMPAGSEDAAALFDRLAGQAPEAAVALYSFGDPALLAEATEELVAVIRAWSPPATRDLLDFGCGIGRVSIALAGEARSIVALDVSAAMVAEARRRTAGLANVTVVQGSGRDFADLPDASIDLILAVDNWPYLVQAGLVEAHLAEAHRGLRPGGDLLVFNWSYRGDPALDVADAARLAEAHGFALLRAGERPFRLWDGAGFHLRRGA